MQKKATLAFVFVLISALMAMALTACGPQSDEDKARAAAEKAIANITATSDEAVKELLGERPFTQAKDAGVDPADISKGLFSHLKTTVESVTVDENSASCKVAATNVDLAQAFANYQTEVYSWASTDEAQTTLAEGGQQAVEKKLFEILIEQLNDSSLEEKTQEITVALEKGSNGEWELSNKEALLNGLMGGIDPSLFG